MVGATRPVRGAATPERNARRNACRFGASADSSSIGVTMPIAANTGAFSTMATKRTSAIQLEPLTEAAAGLLQARGLDLETVERFGVQSVVRRRPRADGDLREWLAFPHFRGDSVVHYEYRTIGPGELECFQSREGERCFWNENVLFDETLHGGDLVITEGRPDALAYIQAGFPASVSICDGAPDPKTRTEEPKKKYSYVLALLPQIHKFRRIILATDADNPGALLLQDLARIVGRARCWWVTYNGHKDGNALLIAQGEAALVESISRAKPVEIPGLYGYDDLPPSPEYPALACGIEGLDDLWKIRVGETTVLVGMPGSGKTTLLNCVGYGMAKHHGWVTVWFSPEQPTTVHKRRLLHRVLKRYPHHVQSDIELAKAKDFLRAHFSWMIAPDETQVTVDWWLEMMEAAAIRHNAKLGVIDLWNEGEHDWPIGVNETDYIGRSMRKINSAARNLGMHFIIVVHPPKLKRAKDGGYDVPDGYDAAGGANWYNKAYMGLSVHRAENNRTKVSCWKAKFQDDGNYGRLGRVMLGYEPTSNRFVYIPEAEDEPSAAVLA